MKKILSLSALAAFVFIASCKKEEDEGRLPNIAFKVTPSYVYKDVTLTRDTTVTVGINASKSEIKDVLISFDASRAYDSATTMTSFVAESLTGTNGDSYSKDVTIHTRNQAGVEKYTFTVINRDGLKNSVSLTITVN